MAYHNCLFNNSSSSSSKHPSSSSTSSSPKSNMSPSSRPSTSSRHLSTLSTLTSTTLLSALLLSLSLPSQVSSAALGVPPDGKIMFGMWYNSEAGYSDNPAWVNQRLGLNVPVFQMSQQIPLLPYNYVTGSGGPALENQIEMSGTDAAVFLTVYPVDGWGTYNTTDLEVLANQLLVYETTYNRTTFLRFAPEMQGTWNAYGYQPTEFLTAWVEMYTTIKSIAPDTIIVWGPNTGSGYPYGQGNPTSQADLTASDTNGDGSVTTADDPYSPYWPGEQYVDWAGLSIYYKGDVSTQLENIVEPGGFCYNTFNGIVPQAGSTLSGNFYGDYCEKYDLPCMMTESGVAYHIDDKVDATQDEMTAAWINDCITNSTWFDLNPQIKLIMQFEYIKNETQNNVVDLRDYRLTNQTDVLVQLQSAFSTLSASFTWANPRAIPTAISSAGEVGPSGTSVIGGSSSSVSTAPPVITATERTRSSNAPSLFGNKNVYGGESGARKWAELGVMVGMVVMGLAGTWRWL